MKTAANTQRKQFPKHSSRFLLLCEYATLQPLDKNNTKSPLMKTSAEQNKTRAVCLCVFRESLKPFHHVHTFAFYSDIANCKTWLKLIKFNDLYLLHPLPARGNVLVSCSKKINFQKCCRITLKANWQNLKAFTNLIAYLFEQDFYLCNFYFCNLFVTNYT